MKDNGQRIPDFLSSPEDLRTHIDKQFKGLSNKEKGQKYESFVKKIMPFSEIGEKFSRPTKIGGETHDRGVDLVADGEIEEEELIIQAKFSLASKKEIDSIVSKFEAIEKEGSEGKSLNLFDGENNNRYHFALSAPRKLSNIVGRYKRSEMSSVKFFGKLEKEGRIEIIDLLEIFDIVKSSYKKQNFIPDNLKLEAETNFIKKDDVYIGILSTSEIGRIYDKFGNSLFLENIREYLGPKSGRGSQDYRQITVNESISNTLKKDPELFLARNNGIAIRASKIEEIDSEKINLYEASVVNGCQTTMSIVNNPNDTSNVLVKVVETEDSWDIAEAANFQNDISQIDLRLARYITPQKVRKAATKFGVEFEGSEDSNAFSIVDSIYNTTITYDEVKALFIGLFSRSPTNALKRDYTKIKRELLEDIYKNKDSSEEERDYVFETLFRLNTKSKEGAEVISDGLSDEQYAVFRRFWSDKNPSYRAILTILASCVTVGKDIYSDPDFSYDTFDSLLESIRKVLDNNPDDFVRNLKMSFITIGQDVFDVEESEISAQMNNVVSSLDFHQTYNKTLLLKDTIDS